MSGDDRLPAPTRDLIRSPDHEVWLSVVSLWEMVVKQQLGRLPLPGPGPAWPYIARRRPAFASRPL